MPNKMMCPYHYEIAQPGCPHWVGRSNTAVTCSFVIDGTGECTNEDARAMIKAPKKRQERAERIASHLATLIETGEAMRESMQRNSHILAGYRSYIKFDKALAAAKKVQDESNDQELPGA